ncbi:GDSL-type esterase/lipase family protein [Arthrobacter sp. 35W]|uniref:GDSL-type esterase/lipase family protein n=1 Tax=Arthrobacter sp. 35W TaxID=1132441 RepID=UPI0009DEA56C|nr:GDSL-type esterase/lipase family protein [Arthrobacter sp. 35W]
MVSVSARWAGVFKVDVDSEGWQTFQRLDSSAFLPPSTDLLADRAAMAAGVRALWQSSGGSLVVEADCTEDAAPFDVLVNGALVARLAGPGHQRHEVVLTDLPPQSAVELWLPHFGGIRIREATLTHPDAAAAIENGPRWTAYGSSITHCQQADGPTETWPALVARSYGWNLTNLGLAGECQLDAAAVATLAATAADLISLCLGINSYNAAAYSERTWAGAVHGFLTAVRAAHPETPIVVITPMLSVPREEVVNAVGWTLSQYRRATAEVVVLLRERGDTRIHCVDGAAVFSPDEAEARMPDTLHPDNAGYAMMAGRLGPQLAAVLSGSRSLDANALLASTVPVRD